MVDNVHNLSYNSRYVAVVHVRWGSYHGGQRAQSITELDMQLTVIR